MTDIFYSSFSLFAGIAAGLGVIGLVVVTICVVVVLFDKWLAR